MEKKIINVLRKAQKILVTMHVNPDLDAVGSALAMTLFLKSIGKDVRLYNEVECPVWLKFIPRASLCRKVKEVERFVPDVAVILDCGDLGRIGKVRSLISAKTQVINIDHHRTNRGFAQLNLVHVQSSSTSEMLYGLLKRAGCVFTKDIAELLYLGILTDTGSFAFECTTSRTHEVVAELLKFNLPVAELYRKVYESIPREDLKLFFAALNRFEFECDGRVACLVMTREDVAGFSTSFDIRENIFSFLRAVKGMDVIAVCTESDKGRVRINFRSRGKIDVARIAGEFNGGGHKNASGCYVEGTVWQAKPIILSAIKKELKWKA